MHEVNVINVLLAANLTQKDKHHRLHVLNLLLDNTERKMESLKTVPKGHIKINLDKRRVNHAPQENMESKPKRQVNLSVSSALKIPTLQQSVAFIRSTTPCAPGIRCVCGGLRSTQLTRIKALLACYIKLAWP